MDRLFILRLAISFFVGGAGITLLTFLAERASSRYSGLIISIPMAMPIGLFFVGWTVSSQAVVEAVPVLPITTSITLMYVVVYVYVAQLPLSRMPSILSSFIVATLIWLLLALPLAYFQFTNLCLSLVGYIVLTSVAYYFLTVRPTKTESTVKMQYTWNQKLSRAAFVGGLMVLIVFLSKTVGSFWGGIFSVFPAAYLSSLLIFHWYRGPHFLLQTAKMMPLGSISMMVYIFTVKFTFVRFGIVLGTLASYITTFTYLWLLSKVMRRSAR